MTRYIHINDAADIQNLTGELLELAVATAKEVTFDHDDGRKKSVFGPKIPPSVYSQLPETLRIPCATLEDDLERDVFLSCALPVLAGIMTNVYGDHGDGPDNLALYMAVVADAGNGKGIARFAKQLGDVIDRRMHERSESERDHWKARRASGENPDTLGEEPLHRSFFVSANSSYRAFVDALNANKGRGVLVDSEIITLTHAHSQEWGNTVDIMLKAWHAETIMLDRKGEKVRIKDPSLSITITGTPKALRVLIPSTENGLLSRFCIYSFSTPANWKPQWPRVGGSARDESMRQAAELLDSLHLALSSRTSPLCVEWSRQHWDAHNQYFASELRRVYLSGVPRALEATVKRGGVVAFRIACALAVLRAYERGDRIESLESITTTDADVIVGLTLTSVYMAHALAFGLDLPGIDLPKTTGQREQWLKALPEEFTTNDAMIEGMSRQAAPRTVRRWIRAMLECGAVERTWHGRYRKCPAMSVAGLTFSSSSTASAGTSTSDADNTVNTDNPATARNRQQEESSAPAASQPLDGTEPLPPAPDDGDDPRVALGEWEGSTDPWAKEEVPAGWTEGSL